MIFEIIILAMTFMFLLHVHGARRKTSSNCKVYLKAQFILHKTFIPEANIDTIKTELNYSSYCKNENTYRDMRSISYTRLLFRVNRPDKTDGESYILQLINDLRNCKGHQRDIIQALERYSMPFNSPRNAFLSIMADFCKFLLAFRGFTDSLLSSEVGTSTGNIDDPWKQLEIVRHYFQEPF